jgi:hypothetical protein
MPHPAVASYSIARTSVPGCVTQVEHIESPEDARDRFMILPPYLTRTEPAGGASIQCYLEKKRRSFSQFQRRLTLFQTVCSSRRYLQSVLSRPQPACHRSSACARSLHDNSVRGKDSSTYASTQLVYSYSFCSVQSRIDSL